MATTEWNIAKSTETCNACNRKFQAAEAYFSALFEQGAGFERQDFCPECFQARRPENVYSYWKTAIPEEDAASKSKPVMDAEAVLDFFRRLAGDQEPQRIAFRYVLALMLTRKKILKLDGSKRAEDGRELILFAERRGGERHEVIQPPLNEEELSAVSAELGRLLGIAPPPAPKPEGEPVAPTPAPAPAGASGLSLVPGSENR